MFAKVVTVDLPLQLQLQTVIVVTWMGVSVGKSF